MCRLVTLLFLFACLTATTVVAQVEIRAPGQQTINVANAELLPLAGPAQPGIAKELHKVLAVDLDMAGLFRQLDPAAFLDDARRPGLTSTQVDFSQWALLGAEILVKGGYHAQGDHIRVEFRLYDVVHRRLLTGRSYVGTRNDLRLMAHKFADQILLNVTGKEGPFSSRIAYIDNRTGHKELYLMDTDGANVLRLTDHRSIVLNPDFSPSGREIVFTSYRRGNPDLFRKILSTGQEAALSSRNGLNVSARFRPDGRELALTQSASGNPELTLLGTDGSQRRRLTNHWGIDVDPSWSPAGDRLAFVSDRQGNPHIFIMDVLSGQIRRLTGSGKYNATPAWSPDGERIAFTRLEGGNFDIYSIRPDGTDERRLTFGAGNKEHPRWSPDSRFLVYSSDQAGGKGIYVMRADGSGIRRISSGGQCQHPAWSRQR
ncbi:Tol-Pal system beta propeller repeat protein TolB [Syntrophotalea acetylenica]|uniref:Tol-Pal system beta propeller repeat protein TolB n=1 Tax=Syntrophotalea acetylenica TaxID=29542 RepID=UPI002A367A55|nr:Tol-Pal system beta propeller repeat protein TolB [Syntrophotalea acetylenica]MDY0261352.1 Tol-Pal system beta propeller repeat protein TolB [Syntrophotalea acetylenica]